MIKLGYDTNNKVIPKGGFITTSGLLRNQFF